MYLSPIIKRLWTENIDQHYNSLLISLPQTLLKEVDFLTIHADFDVASRLNAPSHSPQMCLFLTLASP